MPNQVVIQKAQRYKYDRMVRLPGVILVEAGTERGTTADELAAAIGPQTAALLYPAIDNEAAIVPAGRGPLTSPTPATSRSS